MALTTPETSAAQAFRMSAGSFVPGDRRRATPGEDLGHLGLVHELPGEDRRIVVVAGRDLGHPVAVRHQHAAGRSACSPSTYQGFGLKPVDPAVAALAVLVAERGEDPRAVRMRHRQRVVEGSPVALPALDRERLEEPGAYDPSGIADRRQGVVENRTARHRVPAETVAVRVVDVETREAVAPPSSVNSVPWDRVTNESADAGAARAAHVASAARVTRKGRRRPEGAPRRAPREPGISRR